MGRAASLRRVKANHGAIDANGPLDGRLLPFALRSGNGHDRQRGRENQANEGHGSSAASPHDGSPSIPAFEEGGAPPVAARSWSMCSW